MSVPGKQCCRISEGTDPHICPLVTQREYSLTLGLCRPAGGWGGAGNGGTTGRCHFQVPQPPKPCLFDLPYLPNSKRGGGRRFYKEVFAHNDNYKFLPAWRILTVSGIVSIPIFPTTMMITINNVLSAHLAFTVYHLARHWVSTR